MNKRGLFGWDLPPGVSVSDIPGNRPEDEEEPMKTLTEMLDETINPTPPESQPEKEANYHEIESIRVVVKGWLRTVGLPEYFSLDKNGNGFNTTMALRRLLMTLVDEP